MNMLNECRLFLTNLIEQGGSVHRTKLPLAPIAKHCALMGFIKFTHERAPIVAGGSGYSKRARLRRLGPPTRNYQVTDAGRQFAKGRS
jgi:hypothetical protein